MIYYKMRNKNDLFEPLYPVTSESVDGHSVSYNIGNGDKKQGLAGIVDDNLAVIKKYIGPYSPFAVQLRVL